MRAKICLTLNVLATGLCWALVLEGATVNQKSLSTASSGSFGDVASSTLQQQQALQEKPGAISSPVQSASSAAVPAPSAQMQMQGQQPSALPTSPLPSQQQQDPPAPQPQTFFRRLQPKPGQNLISSGLSPQPAPATMAEAENVSQVRLPPPAAAGISGQLAAPVAVLTRPHQAQKPTAASQAQTHVTSPKFTTSTRPAQSTVSTHRTPPKPMILRARNGPRTERRRNHPRRPQQRATMSRVVARRFRSRMSNAQTIWPVGDYCIMPGATGSCPPGFATGSVGFAVPIGVKSNEMYREGTAFRRYIELGKIGGFDIGLKNSDNIYKISLTACCRVKTA